MGSPPYTWGALGLSLRYLKASRITPIYMGSTLFTGGVLWRFWDHPHIHGEHLIKKKLIGFGNGSPPYTWGALNGIRFCSVRVGITPIYMGSTSSSASPSCPARDHPHIHGEHSFGHLLTVTDRGSPPYTWGALFCWSWSARCFWDHPHIHGEHVGGEPLYLG